MCQVNENYDVNGNIIEEGKEPVHPSKLTLTEALAVESGGMLSCSVCFGNFTLTYANM